MSGLGELLFLVGGLLASVAVIQVAATRLQLPAATLLSLVGIAFGGSYVLVATAAPEVAQLVFAPLVMPRFSAEAYLWLFLPPLLFQVALEVDVRAMLRDAAPILLLAVVAVFVATGLIGLALEAATPFGWAACLLVGAVVATTDPSAVVAIFRDVGAPARLINLVEGESLLNDAAAIALATVLLGMLTVHGTPSMHIADQWLSAFRILGISFGGGVLLGLIAGRLTALLLSHMNGIAMAETALTLALPYPLYLLGQEVLDVSGVVAVVCAALMINELARTRLTPRNWAQLRLVWAQLAAVAGAVVFLLAALRVPELLRGASARDLLYVAIAIVSALLARLLVLFLLLPSLVKARRSEPISTAYRLVIAWGGLRGAVTLVLALGIAENTALAQHTRQFIATTATGFVLFSLLVNGTTLRRVLHVLRLDELSAQDQAMQQQAVAVSIEEVEATVRRVAATFRVTDGTADFVNTRYRNDVAAGTGDLATGDQLSERERLAIGLVTLATRERDLIPEYGDGVMGVNNLDAMMRNAGDMIDAARADGRVGYNRAARRVLALSDRHRIALWLHRHLRLDWPLEQALADRFELLSCRRAVLERLRRYNRDRLTPLLGERMADLLDGVLASRIESVEEAINEMRVSWSTFTEALERRLILLFAIRQGRASAERMVAERVISREIYERMRWQLDRAWESGVSRPPLRGLGAGT